MLQLTTTIQPNDYAVPVHSVKFGDVELLHFSNPNLKVPIGCQVLSLLLRLLAFLLQQYKY